MILGLLVLLVIAWLVLATTFTLVGFLMTALVAGLIGAAADAVVPGRLPGGWIGAVLAGIVGGFVGTAVLQALGMRALGPRIFDVQILPAFVGALLIAVVLELATRGRHGLRAEH